MAPRRRLSAVAIVVPDYDAAIAFYVGQAGFQLVEDVSMGAGKRWVVVSPGAGSADLILAQAVGERQTAAIGAQTGGRVGFFLETDDFARDHARMLAAGVQFEAGPRVEPYGTVAVWRDPFGNRWDLIGRPPADRPSGTG